MNSIMKGWGWGRGAKNRVCPGERFLEPPILTPSINLVHYLDFNHLQQKNFFCIISGID